MQSDDLDFDFTEDEMYRALRLVASEAEAREQAAAFAAAYVPGMNWATSEHALLLLSLRSESARTRIERIRRALQQSRRDTWLQEQHAERVGEADALARWRTYSRRKTRIGLGGFLNSGDNFRRRGNSGAAPSGTEWAGGRREG